MSLIHLRRLLRPVLASTLYREGSERMILRGPGRGLRIRIFPDYGLSPIWGGWESHAQRLMVKHIPPGSTTFDIGANYGVHTLLMARLVGAHGHVYAFEPVPEILAALGENVRLNGFANVTGVEQAAGDSVGYADFVLGPDSCSGHVIETAQVTDPAIRVATTTLDEFVFVRGARPPDFVKIDVEGFAGAVLRGAESVLKSFHPVLLIDLHEPVEDRAVGQVLLDGGYKVFRTGDGRRVTNLTTPWPDAEGIWGQVIALPEASDVTNAAGS